MYSCFPMATAHPRFTLPSLSATTTKVHQTGAPPLVAVDRLVNGALCFSPRVLYINEADSLPMVCRQCQHRWGPIVNMVSFFNAVGTSGLTNVQTSGNNQLSYGRGMFAYNISIYEVGAADPGVVKALLVTSH